MGLILHVIKQWVMPMNIQLQYRTKSFEIIKRGEHSWWVSVSELGAEGVPLPFARVVYFALSADQARAWVARTGQSSTPLALTAAR